MEWGFSVILLYGRGIFISDPLTSGSDHPAMLEAMIKAKQGLRIATSKTESYLYS